MDEQFSTAPTPDDNPNSQAPTGPESTLGPTLESAPVDAPESASADAGVPDPADVAQPAPEPAGAVRFEDLTLGQALGYLLLHPRATGRRLWDVLAQDAPDTDAAQDTESGGDHAVADSVAPDYVAPTLAGRVSGFWQRVDDVFWQRLGHVLVLALAILLALRGGRVLHDAALSPALHERGDTDGAGAWFLLAWMVYGGYALYRYWLRRQARAAVPGDDADDDASIPDSAPDAVVSLESAPESVPDTTPEPAPGTAPRDDWRAWVDAHWPRLVLIPLAGALSLVAYTANVLEGPGGDAVDVVLTTGGAIAWGLSVLTWIVVLGVDVRRVPGRIRTALRSNPDWGDRLARAVRSIDAPLFALVLVTLFGLWFRALDLSATPPEMTSDHIEKLIDALKVHNGYYAVFFPNNGGREAFQMYVVAFFADELGVGFTFDALKWATVVEGVITLPVVFWAAVQVVGTRTAQDRRIGRWIGVALAALLAVSSWHLMLSRLGLRIVLTPLTAALVLGFLARAMRHNRAADYLALGVTLGAGIYFYQANRMLPLVVVAGAALAIVGTVGHPLRQWRALLRLLAEIAVIAVVAAGPVALLALTGECGMDLLPVTASLWFALVALWLRRDRHPAGWRHAGGLLMAVVIALALFVPMYHYSRLYPDQFWNRTRGRLFGENAFVRDTESGVTEIYEPSMREQIDRFWDQRDVFVDNYRDALQMWHWEGDVAWINNAASHPALGGVMGGLLVLGVLVWGVWTLRRRDAVWWLLPVMTLIMLLPSALTLAYTIENPSFTRTSGTIPAIFMLAALPLGVLCWRVSRMPGRVWGFSVGSLVALAILAGTVGAALDWNRSNFYTDYHLNYSNSWKPYREIAKPLRTFAQGEGSYGNAFVVAYPHWLDHRILGAMAGDIEWPNGLVTQDALRDRIVQNEETRYAYDPALPLFLMLHPADVETQTALQDQFPDGNLRHYNYSWQTGPATVSQGEFYIFTAPPGAITP